MRSVGDDDIPRDFWHMNSRIQHFRPIRTPAVADGQFAAAWAIAPDTGNYTVDHVLTEGGRDHLSPVAMARRNSFAIASKGRRRILDPSQARHFHAKAREIQVPASRAAPVQTSQRPVAHEASECGGLCAPYLSSRIMPPVRHESWNARRRNVSLRSSSRSLRCSR